MKLSTPNRHNYSRYAQLCDQSFYFDGKPSVLIPRDYLLSKPMKRSSMSSSFSSVSRQKRGNFRFDIKDNDREFIGTPDYTVVKHHASSYSFSKKEKYQHQPFVEYEVCRKIDLVAHQCKMRSSTMSLRNNMKQKMGKSQSSIRKANSNKTRDSSLQQTQSQLGCIPNSSNHNYSIIDPRSTSPISFYHTSKISSPLYLQKEDLNQLEARIDQQNVEKAKKPYRKGYVQLAKKSPRKDNSVHINFQQLEQANLSEAQFDNSKLFHQKMRAGHFDMAKHLDRKEFDASVRLGPNPETFEIGAARKDHTKINLKLGSFRDKIRTRYDRIEPPPLCQLEYDLPKQDTYRLVDIGKVISRVPQEKYFPVVDPFIKKAGDEQMRQNLKKCIPIVQIDEALRPKNIEHYKE